MSVTTVNISFPKLLLRQLDRVARQEARSRSELLREAARMYVERKYRWGEIVTFWRQEARLAGVKPQDVEKAIVAVRARQRAS